MSQDQSHNPLELESNRDLAMTQRDHTTMFEPLLSILEAMPPGAKPLRSKIGGALLQQNPRIYESNGFTGWKKYAAEAERLGLVVLGNGAGPGHEWISL